MAIYHCSVKIISRSSGRSATAAAAYRAGEEIEDARTGLVHDYSRKGGVDYSAIFAPKHAPDWVKDRATLWNKVEQVEKRKDSQLCREVEVAIPRELTIDQKKALVICFANSQFVAKGMAADINIHHIEGDNPHAHILLTTREITPDGFGQKNREWNNKEQLIEWRQEWEYYVNDALTMAGSNQKVDHRTLEAQNIDRIPTIHLGPHIIDMELRGKNTDLMARANRVKEDNQRIQALRQQRTDIYIQKINHRHDENAKAKQELPPQRTLHDLEREILQLRSAMHEHDLFRASSLNPDVQQEIQRLKTCEADFDYANRKEGEAQYEIKCWRTDNPIRAKLCDYGVGGTELDELERSKFNWRMKKESLAREVKLAKERLQLTRQTVIQQLRAEYSARIDALMSQGQAIIDAMPRVTSNVEPSRERQYQQDRDRDEPEHELDFDL